MGNHCGRLMRQAGRSERRRGLLATCKTVWEEVGLIRYRQVRDERSKIIKRRKRESEIKLVRTGSKDPRTVFSYKVSDRNNHDRIGPLRKDGVVAEKNEDMVELLNEQFSSVFTKENLGSLISSIV